MKQAIVSPQFGTISKFFHWTCALLIILQYPIIQLVYSLPAGEQRTTGFTLHKNIGILVLALVILRLFWRLIDKPPPILITISQINALLARFVHALLYFCMIAMPMTGWGASSAYGKTVQFLGFNLPKLLSSPNKDLADTLMWLHSLFAYGLITLIIFHILSALFHHFIKRDSTLYRMLPSTRTSRLHK